MEAKKIYRYEVTDNITLKGGVKVRQVAEENCDT